MNHQDTYTHNEAYAEFLASWDENFYAKYADTLKPDEFGGRVLDVGCGVGQVVNRLTQAGAEAFGVDVSEPSIAKARQFSTRCHVYNGSQLPFDEGYFASAGALNVLEHVEEPEAFIKEVVRVVRPGGKVLISSPNFLRFAGFRDYHVHMRGIRQKWLNFRRQLAKRRQIGREPEKVRFDRLTPVVKTPFTPDDDAIIATHGLEISFFLERNGCELLQVSTTDRYVWPPLDWALNATPLRYGMFSAFVLARKK
ncbi:MAG: class I SAM-dependent methyltransferase [Pedosphaera sp.]|nr:class I SAM-dependent methyltransferase [Pedosphaera sp.]